MSTLLSDPAIAENGYLEHYSPARLLAIEARAQFERLPVEAVQAWQLARLDDQVRYASQHSPFYRDRVQPAPGPGLTAAEFAKLPFTDKDDLRASYPLGMVAVPTSRISRYGESTGTSGAPTSSVMTLEDWVAGNVSTVAAVASFFGPDDTVFVALPYELSFAAYDMDHALELAGVTVVGVGILSAVCPVERTAKMLATLRPSGLVCSPTRALRLYDLLREAGHEPSRLGLHTILYVGETCSRAKLDKISELWQVQLVSAYGTTETNSLGLSCADGRLHLTEDRHYFELIDAHPARSSATMLSGELVVSTLNAEAMPLLRYRTGDLVAIDSEPCSCGSPRRVMSHLGRVVDRIRIGDRELDRLEVEETVLGTPGTGLYFAAGLRDGRLHVLVEVMATEVGAVVCADVAARLLDTFGIAPVVRPVDPSVVAAVMDRKSKPGSLTLEDLED